MSFEEPGGNLESAGLNLGVRVGREGSSFSMIFAQFLLKFLELTDLHRLDRERRTRYRIAGENHR